MTTPEPPHDSPATDRLPEGAESAPTGWQAMALVRWALVFAMGAAAAISVIWYANSLQHARNAHASPQYYCPMHPQITADQPSDCPICQMSLVLRGTPDALGKMMATSLPNGATASEPPHGLVPIDLPPERLQLLSLSTTPVRKRLLTAELRLAGTVVVPEDRTAVVAARYSGWIQKLPVNQTGVAVTKGETLAVVFSPDVLAAQQEFLSARAIPAAHSESDTGADVTTAASARLHALGLSAGEIAAIAKSRKPYATVALRAPIDGWITQKNAVVGANFAPNTVLFTVADLTRLWVQLDAWQQDARWLKIGQTATLHFGGETREGTIAFLAPTVDPVTRSLWARIELDNRDLSLRPGQFGHAVVRVPAGEVLAAPAQAVVDTGEQHYVFVWSGGGHFSPRPVAVGLVTDDWVEIRSGLKEGEQVVTDGNFLLDSESRLSATLNRPDSAPKAATPTGN